MSRIVMSSSVHEIPLSLESMSFDRRQTLELQQLEQRMEDQWRRKELEWNQTIEQMHEEFLQLYPCDQGNLSTNEATADNEVKVIRKIGGGDVLDIKNLKTVFIETRPLSLSSCRSSDEEEEQEDGVQVKGQGECENEKHSQDRAVLRNLSSERSFVNGSDVGTPHRKLHLRFDLSRFDPQTVRVVADTARITVQARRYADEEDGGSNAAERQFERRIQKPRSADHTKVRAYLCADGVLVVEAPVMSRRQRRSIREGRMSRSLSQTSHLSRKSKSSHDSRSPSYGSPAGTPSSREKVGVPVFKTDNKGVRRLQLIVDVGSPFTPEDIIVQVIKENKIQVMAKHKFQTNDRILKSKFFKEYDLGEGIETYSLAGGLTPDGRVIVRALAKGHTEEETT